MCSYQVNHFVQVVQSSRLVQVRQEDLGSLEIRKVLWHLEVLGRQARLEIRVYLQAHTTIYNSQIFLLSINTICKHCV